LGAAADADGFALKRHEDREARFPKLRGNTLKSFDSLTSLDIGPTCDDDFRQ
jgi:hypothetical protein